MHEIAELFRLLTNLIRVGTIAQVDLSSRPAKVRVSTGALTTDWLQFLALRAGTSTTWDPPTTGEQVLVLCPGGDTAAGIVITGLNSDAIPAPSTSASEHVRLYPDGARVTYDHQAGALTATGIKTIQANASTSAILRCPAITLDGDVTVTGLLSYQAGMSGKNGKGNRTVISGDIIQRDGELSSNGVVLETHTHRVRSLGGETDEPTK
ncbi:baseplate assembly protein [Bordetella trematum]|uniref:Phage P2 baseplate assembly protein gpV n=1 Tax=Bordetella trematum TaxID=123899 RepID=A0A157SJI7_9BORD|nr:phage baseplate assembly protein V [Bordetella trematum]AZR93248.1 baseplate assembly protein [Bordetella trematum]NNH20902.1 phage baseplate assembly protein V [Bordetella trematum]SAI22632.1 Phage P2 baseplate assembly protein gpV [Bordetella trematum]SAI70619.1 Phage P2 baseplate assembly protein gpV [Bordetella trematum]SUV98725.1 Phage P2 baseplate assembly protein gpV [Bordetella trematum]